jgi:hypothetical protein
LVGRLLGEATGGSYWDMLKSGFNAAPGGSTSGHPVGSERLSHLDRAASTDGGLEQQAKRPLPATPDLAELDPDLLLTVMGARPDEASLLPVRQRRYLFGCGALARPSSVPPSAPCCGGPFPPPGPFGSVPRLQRYYEPPRLLLFRPAALRFLRLAVPHGRAARSLRSWCSARTTAAWVLVFGPPTDDSRGNQQTSQVPGQPVRTCPALRPRQGRGRLGITTSTVVPSAHSTASAPGTNTFRGSMTRPMRSLSTLHVAGHPTPRKTRSRLAACLGRTGLSPAGLLRRLLSTRSTLSSSSSPPQAWPGALNALSSRGPRLGVVTASSSWRRGGSGCRP